MKRKGKIITGILAALTIGVVGSSIGGTNTKVNKPQTKIEQKQEVETVSTKPKTDKVKTKNKKQEIKSKLDELKIHYIDVGQGDSILIQQNGHNMLIDAGGNSCEQLVTNYLKQQNITTLDYVVGTHPHEDHIGGLDYVINSFNIGNVFMPKKLSTTNTFKDVITSIKNKNLKISSPQVGNNYELGQCKFTILNPNKEYENINDNSIVIKLTHGEKSFLFTGDAEGTSEMEMVNSNLDLKADVLKLGHHGSKTSTVTNFLNKVNPSYAIVSCSKDNKYKHPGQGVMKRLQDKNIKVYRTDENGTIILTSDGKDIKFNCKEGSYKGYIENVSKKSVPKVTKKPVIKKAKNNVIIHKNSNVNKSTSKSKNQVKNNKKDFSGKIKVWVSATGRKYHRIPNCGRMNPKKAKQIVIDANSNKYKRCEKCFN